MFKETEAFSSFAVDDLQAARDFYGTTLGMQIGEVADMDGLLELSIAGSHKVLIYGKDDHEPATFTVLNLPVSDIDQAVDELTGRGVAFEIYDEGVTKTDDRGVLRTAGPNIAWFRDPAGNILSIIEQG